MGVEILLKKFKDYKFEKKNIVNFLVFLRHLQSRNYT